MSTYRSRSTKRLVPTEAARLQEEPGGASMSDRTSSAAAAEAAGVEPPLRTKMIQGRCRSSSTQKRRSFRTSSDCGARVKRAPDATQQLQVWTRLRRRRRRTCDSITLTTPRTGTRTQAEAIEQAGASPEALVQQLKAKLNESKQTAAGRRAQSRATAKRSPPHRRGCGATWTNCRRCVGLG